ncbi:DUF1292 domain-containing protein [Enterococcus faecalis]|uniref:UPF0473 protein JG559_10495 n=1 Tax=Enterococcus faecalis TaxID=1351 RepID=A0A974NZI7_ENTFL|nr:DUF1292 domain-containing protein [Enterococcus faecalis]
MTEHNHDHDHEGHEHITLVDEQGNETLYEILLTVDGQEEFGKKIMFYYIQQEFLRMKMLNCKLTHMWKNAEGTEGDLQQIETDAEWDMIEEVFNTFMAEEEE